MGGGGFLGMPPEVLRTTKGDHDPDHLHGTAAAIGRKARYVSVVKSMVDSGTATDEKQKL
jgi:hypothetical protein